MREPHKFQPVGWWKTIFDNGGMQALEDSVAVNTRLLHCAGCRKIHWQNSHFAGTSCCANICVDCLWQGCNYCCHVRFTEAWEVPLRTAGLLVPTTLSFSTASRICCCISTLRTEQGTSYSISWNCPICRNLCSLYLEVNLQRLVHSLLPQDACELNQKSKYQSGM